MPESTSGIIIAMKIDRIVHSRRKTIALVIEPDGSLTVRAPLRTSRNLIERLVQDKAAWIQEKQAWIQSHPSLPYQKSFTNGELFSSWGTNFRWKWSPANPRFCSSKTGAFCWTGAPNPGQKRSSQTGIAGKRGR